MEGVPVFEKKESVLDWRNLKAEAPKKAQELIESIKNLESNRDRQIEKLDKLFKQLEAEGNHNRFVASEIDQENERLKEKSLLKLA